MVQSCGDLHTQHKRVFVQIRFAFVIGFVSFFPGCQTLLLYGVKYVSSEVLNE